MGKCLELSCLKNLSTSMVCHDFFVGIGVKLLQPITSPTKKNGTLLQVMVASGNP